MQDDLLTVIGTCVVTRAEGRTGTVERYHINEFSIPLALIRWDNGEASNVAVGDCLAGSTGCSET